MYLKKTVNSKKVFALVNSKANKTLILLKFVLKYNILYKNKNVLLRAKRFNSTITEFKTSLINLKIAKINVKVASYKNNRFISITKIGSANVLFNALYYLRA